MRLFLVLPAYIVLAETVKAQTCAAGDEACLAASDGSNLAETDDVEVSLLQRQKREVLEEKSKLPDSGESAGVADAYSHDNGKNDVEDDASKGAAMKKKKAKLMHELMQIEESMKETSALNQTEPPSCSLYGCGTFDRANSCQCNDKCTKYNSCCSDYQSRCVTPAPTHPPGYYWSTGIHKNKTLYHQTSPEVCKLIMAGNFKIGKGGLCGKAVYFAVRPQDTKTKAITSASEGGCMIEAVVDVGKYGRYLPPDGGWRKFYDGQMEKACGGYSTMSAKTLHSKGYDTIIMRRGDGDEVIVFEPERILEKKIIHFDCKWMCRGNCQKNWPKHCHRR